MATDIYPIGIRYDKNAKCVEIVAKDLAGKKYVLHITAGSKTFEDLATVMGAIMLKDSIDELVSNIIGSEEEAEQSNEQTEAAD